MSTRNNSSLQLVLINGIRSSISPKVLKPIILLVADTPRTIVETDQQFNQAEIHNYLKEGELVFKQRREASLTENQAILEKIYNACRVMT